MPRFGTALPGATGAPAAAPRPPHTAAQGVIGEKTPPNARLGERGASKGALSTADGSLGPRRTTERMPREKQGFLHFRRRVPPGIFSLASCPFVGVSIVWMAFFRGWNVIIPPGYFFVVPNIFGGASPPGFFFVSPVWIFNCFEGIFSRGWNMIIPTGILLRIPGARGFQHFRKRFPPEFLLLCPLFGISIVWKAFFSGYGIY